MPVTLQATKLGPTPIKPGLTGCFLPATMVHYKYREKTGTFSLRFHRPQAVSSREHHVIFCLCAVF